MCEVKEVGGGLKAVVQKEACKHIVKVDGVRRTVEGVLVTPGRVVVYKLPQAQAFHRAYMKESGLALYRGLSGCDSDRLLDAMLEAVAIAD